MTFDEITYGGSECWPSELSALGRTCSFARRLATPDPPAPIPPPRGRVVLVFQNAKHRARWICELSARSAFLIDRR